MKDHRFGRVRWTVAIPAVANMEENSPVRGNLK